MSDITYSTVEEAIEALIKIEKAEEGYLEKKSNAKLDSKTENAGYNNYTKYWRDLAKMGLMGQDSSFVGGPAWYWCAGFQTWCFIKAFGIDLAKKILLHLPYISCARLGELAESKDMLYATPKVGDIVLFWNGSRFSHTGFVFQVTSTMFYTIEGNTNSSYGVVANGGAVALKSYNITTYKKKGVKFFRPDYSLAVKAKSTKSTTTKKTTTTSTKTTKTKSKVTTVTVNTQSSPLRCRKSAVSTSDVIGRFAKDTVLELVEKTSSTWYKVKGKTTDGTVVTGYCAAKFLK